MVKGVTEGWTRELEINGVGYRAEVAGDTINMALGYSHPVVFKLPKGVTAKVDKNRVTLSSADRDLVGQTAAKVRELRPPEPYKGKGVKYVEEVIKRKVGKAGATGRRRLARQPEGNHMLIDISYKKESRKKRHRSLRKRIEGTAERPRLAVFRSTRHIYAQVIDDLQKKTLVGDLGPGAEGAEGRTTSRQEGGAPRRSAPRSPRSAWRRGSTRSCSTAPVTSTTDVSRRWPTARAKRG